jgi:periplasmic divalent cation tolerance protein
MTDIIFLYITVSNRAEADKIAHALVDEKLAACVNIIPGMTSVYRWQGKREEAQEIVLVVKTRAELFDKCAARVKGLHSASCPCIVALPLAAGTLDFLDWIRKSTQDSV